jgi:hypothetical protein
VIWKNSTFSRRWFHIAVLIIIAALTYLIRAGELTYFKDDWYYVYDAFIAGPGIFREMFSIDRPARGFFFEIYYSLFGSNALAYNLSVFMWRILATISALWLFDMLWPKQRRAAFFMAVLFVLYPGYLWWVSPIEYQPMIASLALQVFSIALTITAIQADKNLLRIIYTGSAILTGWAAIWLVDYAIGMEFFRFLCVIFIVQRSRPTSINWSTLLQSMRKWAVYSIIPLGFLIWRIFFFSNERKATDITLQLGALFSNPAETTFRWLVQWLQSILNVGLLAWVVPFSQNFYGLRLRELFAGLALAALVAVLVVGTDRLAVGMETSSSEDAARLSELKFPAQAAWLGFLGTVFGVLPVVLANRSVTFSLSHYALPASLAGVMLVAGLIFYVNSYRVRITLLTGMVTLAVMTHYSILVNAISEEKTIQEFWWQVSWRAPGIRSGTTMVINYPSPNIGNDGFGVMEAPNLIYYPQASPDDLGFVHYNLSALSPSDMNIKDVLVGHLFRETAYRSHTVNFDYKNPLVLSQPLDTSCVHILDGNRPVLSLFDPGNIVLIASKSKIENVLTDVIPAVPQDFAFGPEPAHAWCYYYQKADLALQRGDWVSAASLGNEAMQLKLTPEDQAEWMPFLEAYVILGDEKRVGNLATKIGTDNFIRIEACLNLRNSKDVQSSVTSQMQILINDKYCRNVN